jgi:hypothetical protein
MRLHARVSVDTLLRPKWCSRHTMLDLSHFPTQPCTLRLFQVFNGIPSSCFPCSTGLGSSFDVDLAYKIGEALGDECCAKGSYQSINKLSIDHITGQYDRCPYSTWPNGEHPTVTARRSFFRIILRRSTLKWHPGGGLHQRTAKQGCRCYYQALLRERPGVRALQYGLCRLPTCAA